MFPFASGVYGPVQWGAPEDGRPLGRAQLCRGQSAPNFALNVRGIQICDFIRPFKPNTQTVSPLLSFQAWGSENSGAWQQWVSHMLLLAAASCPPGHFPSLCHGGVTSLLVTWLLQVPFMVNVSAARARFSAGLGNTSVSAQQLSRKRCELPGDLCLSLPSIIPKKSPGIEQFTFKIFLKPLEALIT